MQQYQIAAWQYVIAQVSIVEYFLKQKKKLFSFTLACVPDLSVSPLKKYLSGKTFLPDKHLDSAIFQCPSGLPWSPHGVPELRTVDGWLDPGLCQYPIRGLMIVITTDSFPPTVHCFDNGYVGKQPVARKEYFSEYS